MLALPEYVISTGENRDDSTGSHHLASQPAIGCSPGTRRRAKQPVCRTTARSAVSHHTNDGSDSRTPAQRPKVANGYPTLVASIRMDGARRSTLLVVRENLSDSETRSRARARIWSSGPGGRSGGECAGTGSGVDRRCPDRGCRHRRRASRSGRNRRASAPPLSPR